MTGRGWTQLLTRKAQDHLDKNFVVHMREDRIAAYETWHDRSKEGTLRGYIVLLDTQGSKVGGHHIGNFPPTDEGKAAAEECMKAVRSALRFARNAQIRKENPS